MTSGRPTCRACAAPDPITVLDFGEVPVADVLLRADQLQAADPTCPLEVLFCPSCALLQLADVVAPETLYGDDYPYFSSTVPGLAEHVAAGAREVIDDLALGPGSLVVEAASNDGYQLRVFADAGIPVLGVDPASGPAATAEAIGIPTVVDFFTTDVARRLRDEGYEADALLGNNVLNLVPDPNDFARAVGELLAEDGVAVLEIPYVVDAVDRCAYDNFFHQNCSYFSLVALTRLFERHGLVVHDVSRIPTFGGSLRVRVGRARTASDSVRSLLAEEVGRGVDRPAFYQDFAQRATRSRDELIRLVRDAHDEGRRIVAYGAAGGMATTLLGFAGLDAQVIDYAVDANPHKHGLFTVGSRLPVHPPDRLLADQPDLVLLLAWNYQDDVLESQQEYRDRGGRFVIPVPEPHVR